MSYLYYPLSSKDFTFENIFSSESISPPIFYARRNFGIGYFNVLSNLNHNDAIILYSSPPKYEIENGVKFIIEIKEDILDSDNLVFISEGILAYQKTIYLNKSNFHILFFSEKDRKVTILKAQRSLPTKSLEKYLDNFKDIEEADCKTYHFHAEQFKFNYDVISQINNDGRYNSFKGFVYGVAIGLYNKKTKEETSFAKLIREIRNSYAEFKSRISESNQAYVNNKYRVTSFNESDLYYTSLLSLVNQAQSIYVDFFLRYDEDEMVKLLNHHVAAVESLNDAKLYLKYIQIDDEIYGTSKLNDLKRRFLRELSPELNQLEFLKSQIENFYTEVKSDSKKIKSINVLNDEILKLIKSISPVNSQKDENLKDAKFLDGIGYDINQDRILVDSGFEELSDEESNILSDILNVIFQLYNQRSIGNRQEDILNLVQLVGNAFSKDGKTLLYRYLNNEIDTYSFDKISNTVMKNFVAFIFNVESIEKLENFILSKEIDNDWIAYSFYGAFNGFTNLSGNFTNALFRKDNISIQSYIDNYLSLYVKLFTRHANCTKFDNKFHEKDNEILDMERLQDFFQQFVTGKYKLTQEDLTLIYKIKDSAVFSAELKSKYKINKKEAMKLFRTIRDNLDSPLLFN